MNFTIAIMEDVHNNVTVSFDKSGNEYLVGLYHKETEEYTHKSFKTFEEAQEVFNKFANAILSGSYSYEQRKAFLN